MNIFINNELNRQCIICVILSFKDFNDKKLLNTCQRIRFDLSLN